MNQFPQKIGTISNPDNKRVIREKRRDIAILQSLGILLVVITHSHTTDIHPPLYYWVTKVIASFHMHLFMFISGYLFIYTNPDLKQINFNVFFLKKFKRIIIPYLVLSTLAFGPKVILSGYARRPIDFSIATYLRGIFYPWDNPIVYFWFLPTLFIIFLIFLIASYLFRLPIYRKNLLSISVMTILILIIALLNPLKKILFLNFAGVGYYLFFFG